MKTPSEIIESGLPKNYLPLERLDVCTNQIIGGGNILGVNSFSPLLIGDGEIPRVWLYTKMDKKYWFPLVVNNESRHTNIRVEKNDVSTEVRISVFDTLIIHAQKIGEKHVVVNNLDLRPLGINLHGNENGLIASNSNFVGNVFEGISYMIGFTD